MKRLSDFQQDMICELMNIASGRAAASLSDIVRQRVRISVVNVRYLIKDELRRFLINELTLVGSAVEQKFNGGLNGSAFLLISHESSTNLLRALTGLSVELSSTDSAERSVLAEVGNIILNACVSTLAGQVGSRVHYHLPRVSMNLSGEVLAEQIVLDFGEDFEAVVLKSNLKVGDMETGVYILLTLAINVEELESKLH